MSPLKDPLLRSLRDHIPRTKGAQESPMMMDIRGPTVNDTETLSRYVRNCHGCDRLITAASTGYDANQIVSRIDTVLDSFFAKLVIIT